VKIASHHDWVKAQLGWLEPEHALTALVSYKTVVDGAAAAVAREVVLVEPAVIRDIGTRAIALHREVRPRARGLSETELALVIGRSSAAGSFAPRISSLRSPDDASPTANVNAAESAHASPLGWGVAMSAPTARDEPGRTFGEPVEIAHLISFLAGEKARSSRARPSSSTVARGPGAARSATWLTDAAQRCRSVIGMVTT
jgi:hypothetical protein